MVAGLSAPADSPPAEAFANLKACRILRRQGEKESQADADGEACLQWELDATKADVKRLGSFRAQPQYLMAAPRKRLKTARL